MTETSAELATITEYGPPYWDDRAWDPERVEQRERRLFRALGTGDAAKVLKQLEALEERHEDMHKEYGKTRAFALDFVGVDILAAEMVEPDIELGAAVAVPVEPAEWPTMPRSSRLEELGIYR